MRQRSAVLGAAAVTLLLMPATSQGQTGTPQETDSSWTLPDGVPPPPPGVTLREYRPPGPMTGRRFHVSAGVAVFQGGAQWDRALRDAGFGDSHHIEAGWFASGRDDRYPRQNAPGSNELYFMDVSVGIKPWLATCLSLKLNEPFGGATGFKADAGTGGTEGTFITLDPTIRSYSALLILTTPRGPVLSVGAGPSLTFGTIDGFIRYDNGTPSRGFSVDESKLGFTLRASLELPVRAVRFGLEGQYNYVGSIDVTGNDVDDPAFPTTAFGFNHSFLGISAGIRL